jgi:N-acetyl sugar amidotransferase
MLYCKRCLFPDTKPHITFDEEGVCPACLTGEQKQGAFAAIDWGKRFEEFELLIAEAKAAAAPYFDAMVPVSGGKDSITQVHRLLGYGLRILAVNVDYGIKTDIGRRNLRRIAEMGASLFVFTPEQEQHRSLIRIGFEDFGDPDLLSHTMLHAFPLRVALQFQIPLAWLGENSAFEYGGDSDISESNMMTREWFAKFAANNGMDAAFVGERYQIPREQLMNYEYPEELETSSTRAVFSSYYFNWSSEEHLRIAKGYGFEELPSPGQGTYRTYVGLDEKINRIHQYLKVLKFGYGRATDHACEDIRNGKLTREDAKELVRRYDLEHLSEDYAEDFSQFIGISRSQFEEIIEKWRNEQVWRLDQNSQWFIPGHLDD